MGGLDQLLKGWNSQAYRESKVLIFRGILPFEEIIEAVVLSNGNKSLRSYNFNFVFFREFWDIIKMEVNVMFDQFYLDYNLPKNFLSYFLRLISEVQSPHTVNV